jgi:DNA-binding transcriptional ArsR family regulator
MRRKASVKVPISGRRPVASSVARLRDNAAQAARLLRALSNENRLMLLCLLFEGEQTVGELNESLPLSQSALSQHLAVLREEGMVSARRDGQSIYYTLASTPAQRVIETLHSVYCPRR